MEGEGFYIKIHIKCQIRLCVCLKILISQVYLNPFLIFRHYVFALGLTIKVIGLIFMFAAYKIYKLPKQTEGQVYMEKNGNVELNHTDEMTKQKQLNDSD